MIILRRFLLLLLTSVLLMASVDSFAGGMPVRRKTLALAVSANYFTATKLWDRNGKSMPYANNGKFTSTGLFITAEYGLTRRLTLVSSLPLVRNNFIDSLQTLPSSGFTDFEIGARYYLFNINFKYYFGLQASAVLPLYTNSPTVNLGYQNAGADLKLSTSGSIKVDSLRSYSINVDLGVRHYFATEGPFQVRSSLAVGYKFDASNLVNVSGSLIKSISTNKSFSNVNLAQIKDFSLLQGTVSYGHMFSRKLSVFGGVSQSLWGVNTGIGTNIFVSLSTKF